MEYRSRILKDFSSAIFAFQNDGLRKSPNAAADVPYQKRSAIAFPFGPVTMRPEKASMLYFRKQPLHGVITRPLGSVTEVLPSYHRCKSSGTSSGTPGTRSGSVLSEFVPPFLSGVTNPVWAVTDPPRRQPPIIELSTECPASNLAPFPNGRS